MGILSPLLAKTEDAAHLNSIEIYAYIVNSLAKDVRPELDLFLAKTCDGVIACLLPARFPSLRHARV